MHTLPRQIVLFSLTVVLGSDFGRVRYVNFACFVFAVWAYLFGVFGVVLSMWPVRFFCQYVVQSRVTDPVSG